MENFFITITYLLIGTALRRLSQFSEDTGKVLNLFVIYVSLPALLLLRVRDLSLSEDLLVPISLPWVMLFLSAAAVLAFSRVMKWGRGVTGSLLLLVPLGNTSFLGIPMVKAFFGEKAVSYALLYDQAGSFPALALYGSLILAVYVPAGGGLTVKEIGRKIFAFPPFIAMVLALVLKPFSYPAILYSILHTLASTLVPVVMIAVGFQLSLRLNREVAGPLCFGLAVKLVVAPAVALLLCKSLGLESQAAKVSVFEAGMPPMVSAGALAIVADLSPALTAALVGLGIIVSFVTLPLLYQLL